MSTRKSTNKQNADSIVSLSQDLSTPRSKQSQDAGSETSEPPTTPTSRDSNQSIPAESKRKRRTNSTQSISTPKRSTSEAKDSAANESNDKSAAKDTEEKTQIANTDTPRRRKRRIIEKTSTMSTRKSLADIAAKNAPLRTSARSASKGTSPDDNPKPKRGRKRKADLITTPIKKEPKDSNQSDNEAYEVPDVKRIKIEKVDNEDPEEEILMEIRTEILADIRIKQEDEDKNQVIKIKDENSIKSTDSAPKEVKSMSDKATERKTLSNDSKDDEVVILNTPEKIVSIEDGSPGDPAEGQTGVVKKRRGRKSAANKPQEKKRPTPTKPAKLVTPPKRRGRKPASLLLQSKTTPPAKKTTRKPSKSPVPEKSDSTKTQVPATIQDEETSNLESGELIFSTTTGDVNSDSKDQQREPLLIDTTTQNSEGKDSIPSTECTAGSEKSASLSPVELESEGLSAVSVKQFYKKPEFLENNLGIEEDPKLGEIVQNVEKEPVREEEKESVVEDGNEITKKIEDCVEKGEKDTEQKIEEESMQKIEKETTQKSEKETTQKSEKETAQKTEKETPPKVKKESKLTVEEIQEVLDEDKEESDGKASDVQGADDLEANEVLKEEKNEKTESLPQSKESTPNVKSPESVQGADEADITGSDSLKEGELLVLEDSTEEENTLSQKTDKNGGSKASSPTPTEVKTEPETATDSGVAEVKPSSEESEMEPEIVASEEDQQVDDQGLKKDEIVEDKTIEKDSVVVKNPPNSDVKQIDLKLTEKSAAEITPEDEKEDSKKILVNGDGTDNALLDNDDLEKDAMVNECSAMEIDSGVSDVAENNSNDPNEDLNILQEIIESENPKGEISDSDGVVVGVLPGELEVDKKEDVVDIKEKIQVVESIKVKEIKSTPEKKDIAPIIIRKIHETPETLKQKETHFKSLGLLTIKAADEAKIEKQKRRQQLHSSSSTSSKKLNGNACMGDSPEATSGGNNDPSNGNGNSSNDSGSNKSVQEYTGTLKTVIKLNRTISSGQSQVVDKKKSNGSSSSGANSSGGNSMAVVPAASSSSAVGRHPLKITFQKGRGRGGNVERNANGAQNSNEDTYYTIHNEGETGAQETVATHGRKLHHYRSNTDPGATAEATTADKKEVVIPEKASSFAIHPGRLCQDQCFYCGGKFGLYDTPCHVAQLKSLERQRKILDNEEKLTVDNCLCDACFRHVDRRANAAVQKKRLSAPGNSTGNIGDASAATGETNESADGGNEAPMPIPPGHSLAKSVCFVTNCGQPASHTFRRKGFRKTIRKLLGNDIDMTNMGGRLPICDKHYELIIQCLECALCKRRLIRNHMYHITQDVQLLESLLVKQGIPVKLQANPAVCKLCRYFTNLLVKPPEGKLQKAQFVKNYRRRLLHFHNVQESDEESEAEDQDESASKTKTQSPTQQPAKRGRKPKNQQATTVSQTITSSAPASSEEGNSSNDVVDLEADVAPTSGQMQLDNDVMVDYDMPVLSDSPSPPAISQPSKLQTILQGGSVARSNDDISMALRANPNISMRELFPGEEEMGLQVNVPFGGSSSQRTPEGWTRVQTFLQYDEPTRRLWEDLQKPYGNQSSFIRHLILLEKYFRNGDLILSQTASTNAVAYSETVQNRLRSYDYRASSPTASKNNATASTSSNSSKTNQNQQQQQTNSSLVNNSSSGNSMTSGSHKTSSSNNSRQAGNVSVPDPIKKLHSNLTITITPKGKAVQETTQIYTSPQLALVSTCVVPCVAGMAIVYGKFIRNITRILLDKFAEISKSAEERLSNVKTVKIFCREDQESEKYHNHLLEALQIGYREARAKASFFGLTGLSGNMIIMSVLYYGGTLVMSEQLSVGALTSFILYAGYTAISINGLSNFYTELNKGVGSAQRIWEIIDRKPLITHDAGIYPDEKPIGKIVFDNVQFNFPSRPDSTVLKQFNLTLEPGTTTAIVGRSGSGKTTIASLLLRLYDPLAGDIYLDGRNLRELNPNWLRDNIGAVNQEPVLFSGSVRENILYGAKPGSTVSAELFQKVIQEAHVDEFISKLPDGLDTLVGQRGMMLSGGQKQRVAIARALIKKPTILIFDEATSALDAVSEELVQNALEQMTKGRTVLTIAHRLSTIRNADNIVVLDDGRVVEEGSYEVLMQKDRGIFKGLVGKQAFDLPVTEVDPSTETTRTTGQLVSGQNVNESFDKGANKTPSVSIE